MSKNPSSSEKKQNMFLSSSQELKKVPVLAVCAMFAALALILNSVASINIGPYIKIGFSAIPNQLVDYLFGPVTGSLFAGILDIVKYVMKPDGAFFFGFTFNAMLAAFIYGCFYYKKKLTLRRVLLAKLIVVLVVNVLLSTLWLDMLTMEHLYVSRIGWKSITSYIPVNIHSVKTLGNGRTLCAIG